LHGEAPGWINGLDCEAVPKVAYKISFPGTSIRATQDNYSLRSAMSPTKTQTVEWRFGDREESVQAWLRMLSRCQASQYCPTLRISDVLPNKRLKLAARVD